MQGLFFIFYNLWNTPTSVPNQYNNIRDGVMVKLIIFWIEPLLNNP